MLEMLFVIQPDRRSSRTSGRRVTAAISSGDPVIPSAITKRLHVDGSRSQTPFGNELADEIAFRVDGVSAGGCAASPADTPAVGNRVSLPIAFSNRVWERGACRAAF